VVDDPEKAAATFLKLGTVHFRRHELEAAVEAVENALELLEVDSDTTLRASAQYNLAFYLHARGETDRAESELAAHEELLAAGGDWLALHLAWLRARIAWGRGDLRTAARLFTEARVRALERGVLFDTGLVALELALVLLVRGRIAQVRKLAFEALAIFAEQDVERETRAALELLEAATCRDALTRDLVEKTILSLERGRGGLPDRKVRARS
jgi:tetratricopeptide (TPR) repeat protein